MALQRKLEVDEGSGGRRTVEDSIGPGFAVLSTLIVVLIIALRLIPVLM